MDNHKIILLASYPKSGNTWFRIFMANLFSPSDEPVNINNLKQFPIASSRKLFEELTCISSSELSADEIDQMRPLVYNSLPEAYKRDVFLKIHDNFHLKSGQQVVLPDRDYKIVYFIRNPLDVCVSFAHHAGITMDASAEALCDSNYTFCKSETTINIQFRQYLGNWSQHVESWLLQDKFPVKVVRYEMMLKDTFHVFKDILQFLNFAYDDQAIQKAIENCRFEELKKQEEAFGFKERPMASKSFFRKGKAGSWKEELNITQIQMIIDHHRKVMCKFGYLDSNDNILE